MKNWLKIVAAILAVTTILFFSLWIDAVKAFYEDKVENCQRHAADAAAYLKGYANFKDVNGDDYIGQYWDAVARFYAFMDVLFVLSDDGSWNEDMYKDCQVIYDAMLLAPDRVLAHLNETLAALELVGKDYDSPEARRELNQLSYNLQYVWK